MADVVPTHVAIIPDGNRRWARERGKNTIEGHREGASVTRELSIYAAEQGVQYLSLWGMSLHNVRKRKPSEVAGLFSLFQKEFTALATSEDIHRLNVRIRVMGRWKEVFPGSVSRAIGGAIDATRSYTKHVLNFCLAYNGTDEMMRAIERITKTHSGTVTPEVIKQHLYTHDIPPVDLLIRTGGEPHLSAGFMMWDMADAQLYFTDTYWPAFGVRGFQDALEDFAGRERRRGK